MDPNARFLVVIFEQFESAGPQARLIFSHFLNKIFQFLLDLYPYRSQIGARRAQSTSPLVGMLQIKTFPYVAMFHRGDQQAIYMGPYSSNSLQEVLGHAQTGIRLTTPRITTTTRKISIIDCDAFPNQ